MAESADIPSGGKASRLPVLKTYKLYIDGKFPRTESGRYYQPQAAGQPLANVCLASRKDLRNAVVAARAAQPAWAGKTAYNRSQILYRIGEMLEGRRQQFVSELQQQGRPPEEADAEVSQTVDRLVYYAGWCDKFQQVFSCVNPVASSHFNFSMLEPAGVVFVVASETSPLLGLISLVAPVVAGGNTCVVLASESRPLSAVTFAEVLQNSDVPGGVVNLLTGYRQELAEHFSRHMDINVVACDECDEPFRKRLQEDAAVNVKRLRFYDGDWRQEDSANPYLIQDFCEFKTTWHPVERISASGSGY
jgi:acyl-CoA reductase-like NAD-dependent aldehyde dehydrogenase